jgi:D-amino-acid dehydrogenase
MKQSSEVLILGAGVIGLSCAYFLAQGGRQVTILDQGTPGCGSSHGNCGTITPSHAPPLAKPGMVRQALSWMLEADAPFYVRPRVDPALWRWLWGFARHCNPRDFQHGLVHKANLLKQSRQRMADLVAREAIDCEFEARGHLTVFRDAAALDAFAWWPRALGEVGIAVGALDAKTLRQREPALRDDLAGGFDTPGDAQLRPDLYVAELARVVQARGVRIESATRIHGFARDGDRVTSVHTDRGEFLGAEIILALGAWSPLLGSHLGLKIPVQPGKGYSVTTNPPKLMPRVPIVCRERSVAITPWRDTYRVGSTMEFSGYDASLNRVRLEAMVKSANDYLNEPMGDTRLEEWFGWRPMCIDDLPIIGAAPGLRGFWLATGHGMLGMSMSTATGALIADLILGRAPALDPAPYSAERFA